MHNPSLAYRSDIDGLRALAVLAVIGFHAFPAIIPGGFVGVDVFFVISGFLISSILLKETDRQQFSLARFYARRIKRIFPALLLVLASCLGAGWLVLLSDEFRMLGQHTAAATVFASNFWLWKEVAYFDVAAELKPLLHLWSLAIEEQFYVLWPLLLFIFTRQRRFLPLLVGLTAAISFASCQLQDTQAAMFYFPQNRAWELLLGALLACIPSLHTAHPERSVVRANALSVAGILLVFVAIFQLDKHSIFPGWLALLPTVGAVLVIAAGNSAWLNRYILGSRPVVLVGLISYPLYLWHWPLLSFARIIEAGEPSVQIRIIALAVSAVLSCLTYLLLEKPLRTGGNKTVAGLVALMILTGITGYFCGEQKIKPRSSKDGLESVINAFNDWGYQNGEPFYYRGDYYYSLGSAHEATLFVGDSNVEQYFPRISKVIAENPGNTQRAIYAITGGCPPIRNIKSNGLKQQCYDRMAAIYQLALEKPEINTVVIAAQWHTYMMKQRGLYYSDNDTLYSMDGMESEGVKKAYVQLEQMIKKFRSQGKKVYLILNIPVGSELAPRSLVLRSWKHLGLYIKESPPGINKEEFRKNIAPAMEPLKDIAQRTGSIVLDPMTWVCGVERCSPLTADGVPIYKDVEHLNATFVKEHLSVLDQTIMVRQ